MIRPAPQTETASPNYFASRTKNMIAIEEFQFPREVSVSRMEVGEGGIATTECWPVTGLSFQASLQVRHAEVEEPAVSSGQYAGRGVPQMELGIETTSNEGATTAPGELEAASRTSERHQNTSTLSCAMSKLCELPGELPCLGDGAKPHDTGSSKAVSSGLNGEPPRRAVRGGLSLALQQSTTSQGQTPFPGAALLLPAACGPEAAQPILAGTDGQAATAESVDEIDLTADSAVFGSRVAKLDIFFSPEEDRENVAKEGKRSSLERYAAMFKKHYRRQRGRESQALQNGELAAGARPLNVVTFKVDGTPPSGWGSIFPRAMVRETRRSAKSGLSMLLRDSRHLEQDRGSYNMESSGMRYTRRRQ